MDNLLRFGRTMEEALMRCQSMIHILQFFDFVINLKKSSIDSSSRNIICGNDNKFQGNDFITAKTKNGKYK